jgi:hypothetical protein
MGKIILKIINDKSVGAAFFHAEIYNCMKLKNVYVYYAYISHLGKFTFPFFYRREIWQSFKVLKGLTIPGVTDFQPMSSTG